MRKQIDSSDPKPTKWWQWVLLYPGALVAIIGAVPQYNEWIKAYKKGVSPNRVAMALEQIELWQKNFECPLKVPSHYVETNRNVEVEVTVCPSGDIFVAMKEPDRKKETRWVGLNTFERVTSRLTSNGQEAFAADSFRDPETLVAKTPTVVAQAPTVICQSWTPDGLIKRRLQYPNGQCIDEWINPNTGQVVRSQPAPSCNPQC